MSDTPIEERLFTDEEVRKILQKAVERAPSTAVTKGDGLSLADLKAAGLEVGIDPERLEEAARSVALGQGVNEASAFFGAPLTLHYDRRVKGVVDPEDVPELLTIIRRRMGQQGRVEEIHGSLEWSSSGEVGHHLVSVSAKDETTTITASANLRQLGLVTYLPAGVIGTMLSFITFITGASEGNTLQMGIALTILPVVYFVMRTIVGKVSKGQQEKLEHVLEDIALFMRRGSNDE